MDGYRELDGSSTKETFPICENGPVNEIILQKKQSSKHRDGI